MFLTEKLLKFSYNIENLMLIFGVSKLINVFKFVY